MVTKTKNYRLPREAKLFKKDFLEDCLIMLVNELPEKGSLPIVNGELSQYKFQLNESAFELIEIASKHYKMSHSMVVSAAILRVKESPLYFENPA